MKSFAILAILAGLLTGFADTARAEHPTTTLHIEGMTCAGCETAVKMVLKKTPGVIRSEVSYEEKRAIVTYDATKTSPEKIARAIADALHYEVTVADRNGSAAGTSRFAAVAEKGEA